MAGYPRSDIDANNWQTTAPDDWSWLDHLKAYSSDARTALGNLGSNILDGVSPFAPTATQQGQPSLQVPPMLQGIADSYSRLAGTPSKPGNAYDLTGVPELDAPIQGDMSNVLLSLYGGNALRGRGPALRSEKHRSDTTAHHIVDAELMPDDFRFGASSNVQEASSKFWPTSWGPEDISQWPSSTIERARLFVRRQEAEDQWVPMVDNIMWPDANRQQVMGRSEAEALLLSQRPELKTVADAVYSARRDFYENANPNWRNDPYRVLNEPRYPGVPSPLTEVPNVLSRPKPSASTPKAEAMGRSAVLAENEASKLAEDAYVKAYRQNLDENKYRYFDDWTDDPANPIVADDWGNQIGGAEISDGFSNASPYGYKALNTVPATAYGINEAAAAAGRDLWLSQAANSASHYGTLKTPAGNQYKVRVSDHANTSSKFDQPDFNIAPGEMTPEEFVRLMPTLLSDTGKPSLLGSALATAGEQPRTVKAYHSTPAQFDKFDNAFTDELGFHFGSKNQAHNRAYVQSGGNPLEYFFKWRDIPVEMDIKKAAQISGDVGKFDGPRMAQQLVRDGIAPYDLIASVMDAPKASQNGIVRDWLVNNGYDAVKYPNTFEGVGDPSYMALGTGNVRHAKTGQVLYSDGVPVPQNQQSDYDLTELLRRYGVSY